MMQVVIQGMRDLQLWEPAQFIILVTVIVFLWRKIFGGD